MSRAHCKGATNCFFFLKTYSHQTLKTTPTYLYIELLVSTFSFNCCVIFPFDFICAFVGLNFN